MAEEKSLFERVVSTAALTGAAIGAYHILKHPVASLKAALFVKEHLGNVIRPVTKGLGGEGEYIPEIFQAARTIQAEMVNDIRFSTSQVKEAVFEASLKARPFEGAAKEIGADIGTVGHYRQTLSGMSGAQRQTAEQGLEALEAIRRQTGLSQSAIDELSLGRKVFYKNGQLQDLTGYTPGDLIHRVIRQGEDFRVLGFSPFDFFQRRAIGHGRIAHVVNGAEHLGLQPKRIVKDKEIHSQMGVAIGRKVFAAAHEGQDPFTINMNEDLVAFTRGTSLGRSAQAVSGQTNTRTIADLLEKGDFTAAERAYMSAQQALGQENFFMSPKHAQTNSVWRELRLWTQRVGRGMLEPREGVNPRALSKADQLRQKLGMDVEGYHWIDIETKEIMGKGSMGPTAPGIQRFIKGQHSPDDIIDKNRTRVYGEDMSSVLQQDVVIKKSQAKKAFAHFLIERPNRLLEWMTGIGVKPYGNPLKQLAANTLGVSAFFGAAAGAIGYTNYLAGGIPAKAAAVGLGAIDMAKTALFNVTGISAATGFMEEQFPGSVDSLASQVARGIGLPLAGAALGAKFLPAMNIFKWKQIKEFSTILAGLQILPKAATNEAFGKLTGRMAGLLGGVALAGATIFGGDVHQSSIERFQELSGQKKVEIRNARWWMAGRQPFSGDQVKYEDYSLVNKLFNYDTKLTQMTPTYGSETAFWQNTLIPNPSNAFGLKPLLDPYYLERRFAKEGFYFPETAGFGENIPVLGPTIAATIGSIIKPPVYNYEKPSDQYGVGGQAPYAGVGAKLGFGSVAPPEPQPAGRLMSAFNKQIYQLQQYAGIYGFGSRVALESVTGSSTGINLDYVNQTSAAINDPGKIFADLNLGGGLGLTEYPRRFFQQSSSNLTYYNPLKNKMPNWLPGSESEMPGDRDYRTDFQRGVPMVDMENAYTRLAGDSSSMMGRYKILSDVAAGSDAQKMMEKKLEEHLEFSAGPDALAFRKMQANNQSRLSSKYRFADVGLNPALDQNMDKQAKMVLGFANANIAGQEGMAVLAPARALWDTVTHTRVPGLAWAQGKFMHNRTPVEEYAATQVYGREFADWSNPYEGFVRPAIQEIGGAILGPEAYTPEYISTKRYIEERTDKLKYLKARKLADRSAAMGRNDLASFYEQQAQQTVVGIPRNTHALNRNLFKALPRSERPFTTPFALASESHRKEIQRYIPQYQKGLWNDIWAANQVGGTPSALGETPQGARARADAEVEAYFRTNKSSAGSLVMHPEVDMEEEQLRMAHAEGISPYDLGISKAEARAYRFYGRTETLVDDSSFTNDMAKRQSVSSMTLRSSLHTTLASSDRIDIIHDRSREVDQAYSMTSRPYNF